MQQDTGQAYSPVTVPSSYLSTTSRPLLFPRMHYALSFSTWCKCAKFRTLASPTSITRRIWHNSALHAMPRTILVRPPGGATGRVRRRYAVRQKLQLLEECNRLRRVENLSLRGAAAAMSIPHTVLVRWTKVRPRLIASLGRMKAICEGPVGQLDCIREELLQWIFARREQGIAVTMPPVMYNAFSILRHQQEDVFKDKGFEARLGAVTHFLAKYNFVYHTKTNEATRSPAEVALPHKVRLLLE